MSFEQLLQRQLEEALPLQREEGREWDDVLERAGVPRRRPRRYLALVALVVLLGVAPAYAVAPRVAALFDGSTAPAPATIETSSGRYELRAGSFSWSTDEPGGGATILHGLGVQPRCGDGRTPTVAVTRGEPVRVVLAFRPTVVRLVYPELPATPGLALGPAEIVTWTPERSGVVALLTAGGDGSGSGSAAYVACLELR